MSAMPLIPPALSRAVAQVQSAADPLMPWLLLLLLALAGGLLLRQHRRRRAGRVRVAGSAAAAWAWGLLALLFTAWAWAVHAEVWWVQALDRTLSEAAARGDTPGVHPWALRLSDAGDLLTLALLTLGVAAWLLWRRHTVLAAGWLLGIVINSTAVRVLKNAMARQRPADMADVVTSGFSFPSGHAAGAAMVYGLLVWLLWRGLGPHGRVWVVVAGVAWIGTISATRVLLRVHHASDVLGGWLWAGAMLVATIALTRRALAWQPGAGTMPAPTDRAA